MTNMLKSGLSVSTRGIPGICCRSANRNEVRVERETNFRGMTVVAKSDSWKINHVVMEHEDHVVKKSRISRDWMNISTTWFKVTR